MGRLPYEVYLKIFKQLSSRDIFSCVLVCKEWKRPAENCLFTNLCIVNDQNLEKAITFFVNHPTIASTVEDLTIRDNSNIHSYLTQIRQLCPNLKAFNIETLSSKRGKLDVTETGAWKKLAFLSIEEEYCGEEFLSASELILSSCCPNITKMYINIADPELDDDAQRQYFARVFNALKSAPKLSRLEVTYVYCAVQDLEIIHKNVPNLSSLTFTTPTFCFGTSWLRNIEPTHLNGFRVEFLPSIGQAHHETIIADLYEYIGKKYSGLKVLQAVLDPDFDFEREELAYVFELFDILSLEEYLLPVFERSPGLELYDQVFVPFSGVIAEEMDRCGIQLVSLKLYVEANTVRDQCNALLNSQQSRYLYQLSLVKVDEVGGSFTETQLIEAFQANDITMNNLTILSIEGGTSPVNITVLGGFLKFLPQLQIIKLCNRLILYLKMKILFCQSQVLCQWILVF